MENDNLLPKETNQTKKRGPDEAEYLIYLACADNGQGGDVTRGGAPLFTFEEWCRA